MSKIKWPKIFRQIQNADKITSKNEDGLKNEEDIKNIADIKKKKLKKETFKCRVL